MEDLTIIEPDCGQAYSRSLENPRASSACKVHQELPCTKAQSNCLEWAFPEPFGVQLSTLSSFLSSLNLCIGSNLLILAENDKNITAGTFVCHLL